MPARTPAAIRAVVARLDATELPRFEREWAAATERGRDEYSVMLGQLLHGEVVGMGRGPAMA